MANQPKKYKKFVATAATATLVASAIVPVASAASFSDVPADNEFAQYINALTDEGIINGYPSTNTFKPAASLTRGQVVKMLGRWVENNGVELPSDWKTKAYFKDVPTNHKDQELVKYAALVAKSGVFGGAAGNLMAEKNITRQQMAKVLNGAYAAVNGQSLIEIAEGLDNVRIPDLGNASAEYEDAIQALMNLEISSTTSGNFRPLQNVTRAQFSKFLYNTINFEAVNVSPFEIKAVNNTTVEVIFQEDIESIDKVKFEIDGLKITNAVVKQTNKRTAVLTTESQKGGTEYTVKVDGEKAGTFVGIASVVPSKVELVSSSVQGKLGQEVKVQAKVTVAEGQAKAGIPVTFSIPGNANDAVYPTVTGEAYTDENGVATYTYTRYGAGTDAVTAYATGDRSKFAVGYVFWGVDTIVSVEEVTTGETINNGANKTYKVTYKNATTGKVEANKKFNVSVLENINVTADKLQNVTVNGVAVAQLSNNTKTAAAQITTDAKGEATFTVSGTNAEATPVVFEAHSTTTSGVTTFGQKYEASDLQVTASKVKFAAIQAEYTIDVTRDGGEVAATGETNGREYKVVVKDKAGNVAKNETVNVAFNEDLDRVIATNTKAKFVNADTDTFYPATSTGNTAKQISVKTNDKGEATFVIATDAGNENDYATPIAWIDINNANAKQGSLDEGEPKFVAPISHFQAPYLDGAKIVAKKNGTGKAITNFDGADKAVFSAELVNQSNKVFTAGYSIGKVTYTVFNTGAEDVIVDGVTISPNRSESFTKSGSLTVESVGGKTTSVRVVATGTAIKDGKDFIFTAKETTATFTNSKSVGTEYTGYLRGYNTDNKTLTFDGKDTVKYAGQSGKTYEYYGTNGAPIIGEANFLAAVVAAADSNADGTADHAVRATYRVVDNVVKFYLLDANTGAGFFTTKENTPAANGTLGVLTVTSTGSSTTVANVSGSNTDSLSVSLNDKDLNTDKNAIESATVALKDVNNKSLTLTVVETGVDTGIFTTVVTAGTLKSFAPGVLTVVYNDAKNTANVAQTVSNNAVTLKTTAGTLTVGTFTQATPTSNATVAQEYVSKSIPADYSFASGEAITLNVDTVSNTINLQGKIGAQGVADAINALYAGRATVNGNTVVINSATTGVGSVVQVTSSTSDYFLNVATNTGANAVTTPVAATKVFTITTAVSIGEKVVIDGVEYTAVAYTATPGAKEFSAEASAGILATADVQAANLVAAINANTTGGFSATKTGTGEITLTSTATPTGTSITNPVITLK